MKAWANLRGGDHVEGRLEVGLGLAREPDDDVGADGCLRDRRPHPLEDAEEPFAAVGAPHRLEHDVGTRLQRHVQLRHDRGGLRHRLDDVVGEGGRVRAGEPDPLQTRRWRRRCAAACRERPLVAELDAVGVDVLTEQGDLDDAFGHQGLHLGQDVARPAVLLLAAQGGHDAERAGVVAADADRHPGGVGRVPPGGQGGREGLQRLEDLDLGPSLCRARSSSAGRDPRLWVPKTTSTQGAFARMVCRSFCARQPPTAICMPGRAALAGASWPRLP